AALDLIVAVPPARRRERREHEPIRQLERGHAPRGLVGPEWDQEDRDPTEQGRIELEVTPAAGERARGTERDRGEAQVPALSFAQLRMLLGELPQLAVHCLLDALVQSARLALGEGRGSQFADTARSVGKGPVYA